MVDKQLPGLYNARRDSLGKYWKGLFGVSHAVMLVDSFFENVQLDGKNQVLHFVPRPAGTMLIACLCAEWKDPQGGPPLLSFAAITDEPPPEVAAAGHDRMIISLKPETSGCVAVAKRPVAGGVARHPQRPAGTVLRARSDGGVGDISRRTARGRSVHP